MVLSDVNDFLSLQVYRLVSVVSHIGKGSSGGTAVSAAFPLITVDRELFVVSMNHEN